MPFACTHIIKEITVDNFETGCETTQTCVLDQKADITGETLRELFTNISKEWGFSPEIDELFIPDPDGKDISYVGFDQLENSDGYAPTDAQTDLWKKGEIQLWLADYSFLISFREVRPVTMKEIMESGIKTH